MSEELIEKIEDGIATLTLNRPESRNALTRELIGELVHAVERLAADSKVRVVVLTGAGGAFCAGGDIREMQRSPVVDSATGSFEEQVASVRAGTELSRWLHEMPKPTLAVIPGATAGAGLSIALACDMRIAANEAKMTTAFAKIGLSGDFGGSFFLTHLVGSAKARELYFTADVITGAQAAAWGLVNMAVPAEELSQKATDLARQLSTMPTIAIGCIKNNIRVAESETLSDVLDAEANHLVRTMGTNDHRAAITAFLEKRLPSFQGT